MMSPLNRPASCSAIRSRSCSSIVDDLLVEDVVTDITVFLSVSWPSAGDRGLGQAAHGVQGGRDGLQVVPGHGVRVRLLLGRPAGHAVDDQSEAEPQGQVAVVGA